MSGGTTGRATTSSCSARPTESGRTSPSTGSALRYRYLRVSTSICTPRTRTTEVERLVALGATEVHWDKRPPDADYVILADPEGNRFCVVDVTH